MATIDVHFLPSLTTPEALSGATVVVIDVLRATTTIATALAAGAKEVIPCLEVGEARRIAAELPQGAAILGGERGGERIDGFELCNSPLEYTPGRVGGKTVVFTTTNGTRALEHCRQASRVWLGAIVNLSTVAERIARDENIHILCAGTVGKMTAEDVLTAGMVSARIVAADRRRDVKRNLGDGACVALGFAEAHGADEIARRRTLFQSNGGRNLARLGMAADIRFACQLNRLRVAPELDLTEWRIRLAH